MTNGEQLTIQALGPQSSQEGSTFLWWFEPTLRDRKYGGERCPDFVILDSKIGLVVLEVKDWAIDQIKQVELKSWSIRKGGKSIQETAPVEQARAASHMLRNLLETDDRLLSVGGAHAGKCSVPVSYGAILPNVTRAEAQAHSLLDIVQGQNYFFRDDLLQGSVVTEGKLASVLREKIRTSFQTPTITLSIQEAVEDSLEPHRKISTIPDLRSEAEVLQIERLDAEQKAYAHALGDGHRILTGCAGSGKTLVVAARARFLKQIHPGWRIRIMCYNSELVPYINGLLGDMSADSEPKIRVMNFHAFARECIGIAFQLREGESDGEVADRTAEEFLNFAEEQKHKGNHLYDALLIDEGQDLRPEWTKALVGLVNPQTNSVLFSASRQQNIYGIQSYKDMGIEAKGRTTHLRKSYRCSVEIIALAESWQPDLLQQRKQAVENAQKSLFPLSARGSRRLPQFIACSDTSRVCAYICEEIRKLIRAGQCDYKDIAILYTDRYLPALEPLTMALRNEFAPHHVFAKWKVGRGVLLPEGENSIKMMTIHSSKGLEWRIVFLLGMDKIPRSNVPPDRQRSLAYVALTRAQDEIHFVSLHEEGFHQELKGLSGKLAFSAH